MSSAVKQDAIWRTVKGVRQRHCCCGDHWLPATSEFFSSTDKVLRSSCRRCLSARQNTYRSRPSKKKIASDALGELELAWPDNKIKAGMEGE